VSEQRVKVQVVARVLQTCSLVPITSLHTSSTSATALRQCECPPLDCEPAAEDDQPSNQCRTLALLLLGAVDQPGDRLNQDTEPSLLVSPRSGVPPKAWTVGVVESSGGAGGELKSERLC
jgi:hypothetical protein